MTRMDIYDIDSSIPERIDEISKMHTSHFNKTGELTIAYAPGRAEILGSHTDYNQGLTLSANVASNLLIVASKREDRIVRISSMNEGNRVIEFEASDAASLFAQKYEHGSSEFWANYVKGVLWAFLGRGHSISGFEAIIQSTIPSGGGLSSSAALETALSRLIVHFNNLNVNPYKQVQLNKLAENDYVGAPCGFLDQATVGLADSWLEMSYRPVGDKPFTYEILDADFGDTVLVAGYDPESKHALVDGKYAVRQQACFASVPLLAQLLGRDIVALRDISSSELADIKNSLLEMMDRQAVDFVTHVIYENERVTQATEALRLGNIERLAQLMTESGESALNLYKLDENSPELRFVYETVASNLQAYGALGIRNMGGGFNATTLALISRSQLDNYRTSLCKQYKNRFGRDYHFIDFTPSPAACIIEN